MKTRRKWTLLPATGVMALTILSGLGGCSPNNNNGMKADNSQSSESTSMLADNNQSPEQTKPLEIKSDDASKANTELKAESSLNTQKVESTAENGAIQGWVADETNSDTRLEGAAIEAINENDRTKTYQTSSDKTGHFELILPEGIYSLTVQHEGYENYVKTGVKLTNEIADQLEDWINMKPIIVSSTEPEFDFSGHYFVASKGGEYDIYLDNDGIFTATYRVDNPFASELTVIQSEFKGKFSSPAKTDDYTYSLTVESGESTYGNETIREDGVVYDCRESEIRIGSEFRIFTKDAPDSSLPITFVDIRNSVQNGVLGYSINPEYTYLLYDVSNDRSYCSEY